MKRMLVVGDFVRLTHDFYTRDNKLIAVMGTIGRIAQIPENTTYHVDFLNVPDQRVVEHGEGILALIVPTELEKAWLERRYADYNRLMAMAWQERVEDAVRQAFNG